MKNNRLFGIIYLLLSNNTMTAKELGEYFEVSVRTIYRDIEALSKLKIPIYMSKGKNGGIQLLENYKLNKILLSDDEQNQILFSLQSLNTLKINTNDTYEKLKNIFSKEIENWFEVDFSIWGTSPKHKENFEIIKQAIIHKNIITFSYFNTNGIYSERKVEPLKLYFKYNAWYLYGFDQNKQDYRLFKIMRIKNLIQKKETFQRTIPSIPKETENVPTIKLVLQINKSLSYRVYDEFDQENITQLEDGSFIASVEIPYSDWVYGYILSFGEHAKVLEPENIKKEVVNRLKKALKKYS